VEISVRPMHTHLPYAPPAPRRRGALRSILVIVGVGLGIPLLFVFAAFAWFAYETSRNEVILMVKNKSSETVDAMVINSTSPRLTIMVEGVPAGEAMDRDQNTWRELYDSVFRVQVGKQIYEGDPGVLLEDDGPHRFWVEVFDDHVEVTRQSNEDPWQLEMLPMDSGARSSDRDAK